MKIGHIYRCLAGAILTLGLSLPFAVRADNGGDSTASAELGINFSRIIAFGDSLSDTGNYFAITGIPPAPYYFEGNYSNGKIWLEYLAQQMGLNPGSIANYAIGGATTGRDNENDPEYDGIEFPGLQDELDQFENHLAGGAADAGALYVIWAGANDFLVYGGSPETVGSGIGNTVLAVQRLFDAGARHIMVVNLPDLGLTPFGAVSGDPSGLSQLTAAYNQGLNQNLDLLADVGIETIRVDSAGIIQDIVANGADLGFTNVTDTFLPNSLNPSAPNGITVGGNPDEYLFFDVVHPTTRAHSVVADEAMRVLCQKYPATETPWQDYYEQGNAIFAAYSAIGDLDSALAWYYYFHGIGKYVELEARGESAMSHFEYYQGLALHYYHVLEGSNPGGAVSNYYYFMGLAYYFRFALNSQQEEADNYYAYFIAVAFGG